MPHTDPILKATYAREYREKHKAELAEKNRVWREVNAEVIAAKKKADYTANKDAVTARVKAYREANADKIKAKRSTPEYREKKNADRRAAYVPHPLSPPKTREEILAGKKADYQKNREKYRAIQAAYYQENKDKWKGAHFKIPYWRRKFQGSLCKAHRKGGEIIGLSAIRDFYKQVFTQTAATCDYCRGIFAIRNIVVDHKQPFKLGGVHAVANFAVSCELCNLKKGVTPYDSWIAKSL